MPAICGVRRYFAAMGRSYRALAPCRTAPNRDASASFMQHKKSPAPSGYGRGFWHFGGVRRCGS
ncbi:hypothetical protein D3C71_2124020 [compost metagenome]